MLTKPLQDFKRFLLRGNVVDLAVAVVIGAAFGAVVKSAVEDLVTPLIGIFGKKTSPTLRSPYEEARSVMGSLSMKSWLC